MTMAAFFLPFLLDALEAVCGNRICFQVNFDLFLEFFKTRKFLAEI